MKDKDLKTLGSPVVHQWVLRGTPSSVSGTHGRGLPENQEHPEATGQCPKGSFKGAGQWGCI